MGIFEDVVTNAKSAAQTVGKVAGQFVDMSKLRLNLVELNSEINKQYKALGQFIYEGEKAGCVCETEKGEKLAALDELYAQFGVVSAQLAALQKKVVCPACGKQVDIDSMFCNHCGMKLDEAKAKAEKPEEPEETPVEETPEETPVEETAEAAEAVVEE